jgi:hypothetical protein
MQITAVFLCKIVGFWWVRVYQVLPPSHNTIRFSFVFFVYIQMDDDKSRQTYKTYTCVHNKIPKLPVGQV